MGRRKEGREPRKARPRSMICPPSVQEPVSPSNTASVRASSVDTRSPAGTSTQPSSNEYANRYIRDGLNPNPSSYPFPNMFAPMQGIPISSFAMQPISSLIPSSHPPSSSQQLVPSHIQSHPPTYTQPHTQPHIQPHTQPHSQQKAQRFRHSKDLPPAQSKRNIQSESDSPEDDGSQSEASEEDELHMGRRKSSDLFSYRSLPSTSSFASRPGLSFASTSTASSANLPTPSMTYTAPDPTSRADNFGNRFNKSSQKRRFSSVAQKEYHNQVERQRREHLNTLFLVRRQAITLCLSDPY